MALSADFFIHVNRQLTQRFGGLHGVRSLGALESALARFSNMMAYSEVPNVIQASAAMAEGIVRNHPFIDGNKRTAVAALHISLEMNGLRLEAPTMEQVVMIESLASRTIGTEVFGQWVEMKSINRDVYKVLAQRDAGEAHPEEPGSNLCEDVDDEDQLGMVMRP